MSDFGNKLTTVVPDEDDVQMDIEPISLPPHLQHLGETGGSSEPSTEAAANSTENAEEFKSSTEEIEHDPTELRPGSLLLKGVDELDTRAIKLYIDSFLKPDFTFENREQYAKFNYRLEWINDYSINIVFEQAEAATEALALLSEVSDGIPAGEERPAMEYISNDPGFNDQNVRLSIRQSFYGDRKVKNAKNYSRYYLVHGEPEPIQRTHPNRRYRSRDDRRGRYVSRGPDLITGRSEDGDDEIIDDQQQSSRRLVVSGRWDEPGKRRRGRRGGRSRERGGDLFDKRPTRDEEEDLFPNFGKNRDRSPLRG